MIDERYQGRGYRKKHLQEIIKWVKKYQDVQCLVTTYKMGNEIAKRTYESFSFKRLYMCE